MNSRIILISLLMIGLTTCKSRNLVTSEDGVLLELPDNAYSRLHKNLPEYEYLSVKAKVSATSGKNVQNFTLILKMRKDSFIWASVSGFGFEAVRALITPDSVTVIDRIGRKYYKEDIGYLNKLLGFEVTLSQLQTLLVGGPPLEDGSYTKLQHDEYHEHLRAVEGTMQSILLLNSGFLVNRSRIEQLATKEVLDIRYLNYEMLKGTGEIPADLHAKVSRGDEQLVEINLHYTSVSNEKFDNLPISIPSNYEKGT